MGEGSGQHTEHTRERLQNARIPFLTHPDNSVLLCEPPRFAYGGTWDLWSPSGDNYRRIPGISENFHANLAEILSQRDRIKLREVGKNVTETLEMC